MIASVPLQGIISLYQYGNLPSALLLMAPINLLGVVSRFLVPANPDLYLDNVALAWKAGHRC